ncbi:MAG TPA: FAD-binding protein [Flavisolibacter sp.]|nr:FAD-binding protein [Flavisolibacter sp.]
MGDLQIKVQPKVYDAIIIGSGAGGGMAAYTLANAGLKVALVEAGPESYLYRKRIEGVHQLYLIIFSFQLL